jgi:exopolysaccharide biosynthesis polyprenyl glycosylphosphotransferase
MRDWAALLRRTMPLIDFLLIILAFRIGYALRYEVQFIRPVGETFYAPFEAYWSHAIVFGAWMLLTPPVIGLYFRVRGRSWAEETYAIAQGATTATVLIMALNFLLQPLVFSRLMILEIMVLTVVFLSGLRLFYRTVQSVMRARGVGSERVLVIGAGEVGRAVIGALLARKDLGYDVAGYLDDNPERGSVDLGRIRGFGATDNLPAVLDDFHEKQARIDLVLIALPWRAQDKIMEVVRQCEQHHVPSMTVPDLFRLNMSKVRVETLAGFPVMGIQSEPSLSRVKRFLKRTMDVLLIILAAPFLIIPGLLIALLIKLDSPGPVLYRHRRVGENGGEFDMFKFRSMYVDADKLHDKLIRETGIDGRHFKMKDDPRITRVGKWLRRLSIDEWPNFINILRGEMSLIGPRAPTPKEVAQYEPWQRQRLNTLPGLSGLWQVSGRSNVPFEEMCLLDIYYIENWSIALDIQIMLRTIPHVLFAKGAY